MPVWRAAVWTLSSFAVVNVALSLVVATAAGWLSAHATRLEPAARARVLLAMRLLPLAGSGVVAGFMILPSFIVFEPDNAVERVSIVSVALALFAVWLFAHGAWRGARALSDLSRLSRAWLARAEPFSWAGVPMPIYRTDADVPPMTLIGFAEPTVVVSRSLLDLLTTAELNAAFEHEYAHRRSWDNLKRLLICLLPDALSLSWRGWMLDREWALAAELAADEQAAWDSKARMAMASALVKAARLPLGERIALASPLVEGTTIADRVERLLTARRASTHFPLHRKACWLMAAAIALLAAGGFAYVAPIQSIHAFGEVLFEDVP